MKQPIILFLCLLLSLCGMSQGGAFKDLTTSKMTIGGTMVNGISRATIDSSIWPSDSLIITSKAVKAYIDKRLAACGCNGTPQPAALAFTQQPQSATVIVGQNASFSVGVTGGTTPYTYQWKKGGTSISGATSATYALTSVQLSAAGSYTVMVTDAASSAITSGAATLTVNSPPLAISQHPQGNTINVGENVSFTVAATGGSSPYTYQWKKGGTNITGATSSTFSITNAQSADAGMYTAAVTDAASATQTSNPATLVVNTPAPTITVSWGSSSVDPFIDASTAPNVTYSGSQNITHNANFSFTLPQSATGKYIVFKVPAAESAKTMWYNTALNQGQVPDQAFRAAYTVGGWTYYVTRAELGFDYTQPITLQ